MTCSPRGVCDDHDEHPSRVDLRGDRPRSDPHGPHDRFAVPRTWPSPGSRVSQLVRGLLYVADDPTGTLSNLVEHPATARLGIVLELAIVFTQALAAVWFYRLFRSVDSFAAGLIAVFGMVNAVAILGSAAALATALDVADEKSLAVSGSAAATVQLLYVFSGHLWGVGGLFFGLWLIPMGWLVVRSGWLPRVAGPTADGRRGGLRAQHLRQLHVRPTLISLPGC